MTGNMLSLALSGTFMAAALAVHIDIVEEDTTEDVKTLVSNPSVGSFSLIWNITE